MPSVLRRRHALAAAAILLGAGLQARAAGLERLQRKFDFERGLPFSEVNSIAQDTRGFLWVTAGGGLFRYDGFELRSWAREPIRRYLKAVAAGPGGEILVREGPGDSGRVYAVVDETVRPVVGPDGSALVITGEPVWDGKLALWVISGDRVWVRSDASGWRELPPSSYGSERPRLLKVSEDGAAILCTESSIWRVGGDASATRLGTLGNIQNVIVRADGSFVALTFGGPGSRVLEVRSGETRELFQLAARPIDMVRRGSTLWVAFDTCLVALRPGEAPEVLGASEHVPGGGPLLVDSEGSLWLASFRGLLQYPAPDTAAWLTDHAARRVAEGPEGLWFDSWSGLSLLRRHGSSWSPEVIPDTGTSAICTGSDGAVWAGYPGRILERRDGRFVVHAVPELGGVDNCASGADSRVWLSTNVGLIAVGEGAAPSVRPGPPSAGTQDSRRALLEDARGQLWVAQAESICHADAFVDASGGSPSWTCGSADGAGTVTSLAEVSPGALWAASLQAGVYRLGSSGRWVPIPGSRSLPTLAVRRLRASPSGGAWIVSYGTVVRAVERPGSTDGWEIVERIGPWHGLMISDAEDVLEEPDGDLWITTLAGAVHVAAEVRRAAPEAPPVELVDVSVDGKPLAWRNGFSLPFRRNRIELRFAALSFRDPSRLRYQVRLRGDAPWVDSSRPSFQFVDLPPGSYHPEVRASLDGERWSTASPRLAFNVTPPYWKTWWFAALAGVGIFVGSYALYRARLAHLLAVERVRTHIATDLHDDIGASLSRTAILAEVVQREIAPTNPAAAQRLEQIARSAREVVDGMADVVWSLDPEKDDLGQLVVRIRAFASEVLSPSGVAFTVSGPSDPSVLATPLDPEPRRQAYLVVKEAILNVARHASAKRASIAIELRDGAIEAVVSDDGRGFSPGSAGSPSLGGNGLRNMRARASRLRGEVRISSAPGEGTTIRARIPIGRTRRPDA